MIAGRVDNVSPIWLTVLMNLYIELRDRTRSSWVLSDYDPSTAFDLLDAWNRWQFGASLAAAGNWVFDLVEYLDELPTEERQNAGEPQVRQVEIQEIGSILATQN